MDTVCAWCGATLRRDPAAPGGEPGVSHGICESCLRGLLRHRGRPLAGLLAEFPDPVLAVDGDGRVLAANRRAGELLGKAETDLVGLPGGDAFDCRHAREPGGCGGTVHCRTCTIRTLVTETLRTGEARRGVPAYADLHDITGDHRVRFLVSTCRFDGAVLLRVDEVAAAPPGVFPPDG